LSVETPADLTSLSAPKWKSSLGFNKPKESMAWVEKALAACDEIDAAVPADSGRGDADYYMEAFEAGIPENNVLILLAEEVDKRKRFFKFIKSEGAVLDLSVSAGSTKAAKTDQDGVLRGLISKTLSEFSKKIEPGAIPVLLERVGFHPVAVVRETEKLALYTEEGASITLQDVNAVVGRTREDALYELTESYSDKNLTKALHISARMLESGVHPLVLVAGLRNHLRKLLLVCSFRKQPSPVFVEGMSFGSFQKGYLAQLKSEKEELIKTLPNHPYALFMMFEKAGKHSIRQLVKGLRELLEAESRLKSSPLPGQLVFENFLFEMLV
jgi:DNA polymerase-3 subunit delta